MALTKEQIAGLSDALLKATSTATPITNIVDQYPEMTIDEAYEVQLQTYRTRIKNGDTVVGRKVGLSAKKMQEVFNVNEPVFGHLFASMMVPEGVPISKSRLCKGVLEGEMAFVLKNDLKGPVTMAKVMASIAGVVPAFEIADTRCKEKPKKAQDIIADASGAAMVMLGGQFTPIDGIDLRQVGMILEKNGEVSATATGVNVLGNPVQPIVDLVNKLAQYDIGLSAGEFIISGTPHPAAYPEAGENYRVTFDHFGYVSIQFTD
jgi:2-keto-4-pentenoate hydratase